MKFELKSIGYWSLIKVSFIVNLVMGFIMGIFFAMFVGLFLSLAQNLGGLGGVPMFQQEGMPPFWALLMIYPFIFGFGAAVFYTVLFLIAAFIYNVVVKLTGGLEFELTPFTVHAVAVPSPTVVQPSYYAVPLQPSGPPPPPPPPPPAVQPLPPDISPPPTED